MALQRFFAASGAEDACLNFNSWLALPITQSLCFRQRFEAFSFCWMNMSRGIHVASVCTRNRRFRVRTFAAVYQRAAADVIQGWQSPEGAALNF